MKPQQSRGDVPLAQNFLIGFVKIPGRGCMGRFVDTTASNAPAQLLLTVLSLTTLESTASSCADILHAYAELATVVRSMMNFPTRSAPF